MYPLHPSLTLAIERARYRWQAGCLMVHSRCQAATGPFFWRRAIIRTAATT